MTKVTAKSKSLRKSELEFPQWFGLFESDSVCVLVHGLPKPEGVLLVLKLGQIYGSGLEACEIGSYLATKRYNCSRSVGM